LWLVDYQLNFENKPMAGPPERQTPTLAVTPAPIADCGRKNQPLAA